MRIVGVPIPFEQRFEVASYCRVRRVLVVDGGIVHDETNAGRVDEIISRPIRRTNVCRVVCNHVFVVVYSRERNMLLFLAGGHDKAFLNKKLKQNTIVFRTTREIRTISMETFG